jgi:hypothetical protein
MFMKERRKKTVYVNVTDTEKGGIIIKSFCEGNTLAALGYR